MRGLSGLLHSIQTSKNDLSFSVSLYSSYPVITPKMLLDWGIHYTFCMKVRWNIFWRESNYEYPMKSATILVTSSIFFEYTLK